MEAPLDQPPTIDVDVFNLILACLPQADLLRITLISHFAREEAIKELFMRPVRLLRNENLHKFCQFALAGDLRRLSCLQKLTIEQIATPFSSEDGKMVANVLAYCMHLRILDFRQCDGVIVGKSVILEAISALPNLAYLSASIYTGTNNGESQDLVRMVLNMNSSLRGLHLPMDQVGLSKVSVLQDLARVHSCLEELTLSLLSFTPPRCSIPYRPHPTCGLPKLPPPTPRPL